MQLLLLILQSLPKGSHWIRGSGRYKFVSQWEALQHPRFPVVSHRHITQNKSLWASSWQWPLTVYSQIHSSSWLKSSLITSYFHTFDSLSLRSQSRKPLSASLNWWGLKEFGLGSQDPQLLLDFSQLNQPSISSTLRPSSHPKKTHQKMFRLNYSNQLAMTIMLPISIPPSLALPPCLQATEATLSAPPS